MSTIEESSDGKSGSCGEGWSSPRAAGKVSPDGERCRVKWWPASGTTKIALFRLATDDSVAVIQHIRTIVVQQRGDTTARIDPDADLADVPDPLIDIMQAQGVKPANSADEVAQ
ncbi:hypothetical protein [Natronoarchaeum rubrum]|uniref:hypothetical protein n=1 Tax=Natronoarchaeum rubrum TaxID=755311 RepID=UPI002112F392|nr:hypothetical protein [Natronoarchaeum rubrum]